MSVFVVIFRPDPKGLKVLLALNKEEMVWQIPSFSLTANDAPKYQGLIREIKSLIGLPITIRGDLHPPDSSTILVAEPTDAASSIRPALRVQWFGANQLPQDQEFNVERLVEEARKLWERK